MIVGLFLTTGCSVSKEVRTDETKELTKSVLESNKKVKELNFYFRRPSLNVDLAYDGDLEIEEIEDLIDEFKALIDMEFMEKIGEKYWKGTRPYGFNIYIHIDKIRKDNYDYLLQSNYRKYSNKPDGPDNIDGYQSYSIIDNTKDELEKNLEDESTDIIDSWGIELSARNIRPTGMTLICNQSGGESTGELHTGSYYFLEEEIDGEWIEVEIFDLEYDLAWTDEAWVIPMNDTVGWEIDWEWLYGELPIGRYRMGKEITDFRNTGDYDTKIYYAAFVIQ